MEWMIWYGDGSRFTSEDGSPWDAPRLNVQLIATINGSLGWDLISQSDYYYFDDQIGVWFIADTFAIWDVLIRCKHPLIFFGRYISDKEYNTLIRRAIDELPSKKSTWRNGKPSWLRGT